jgi:hypothetical protein
MRTSRIGWALAVTAWTASGAGGQESTYRSGSWMALGLGGANVDVECAPCTVTGGRMAPTGFIRFGGRLQQKWSAAADVWAWIASNGSRDGRLFLFSVSGFFYPFLDSGLNGSIGLGGMLLKETETGEDISMNGVTFRFGIGYDRFLSPGLALTPFVNLWLGSDLSGTRNRRVFLSRDLNATIIQFGLAVTKP